MIKRVFSILAILLFVISLVVHLLTFSETNLQERFPFVWVLHLAVLAFIVPIIFLQQALKMKVFSKNLPKWALILLYILGIYAVFNFAIFFFSPMENTEIINGKYFIKKGSEIIREISKSEYDSLQNRSFRLFSVPSLIAYFGLAIFLWGFEDKSSNTN